MEIQELSVRTWLTQHPKETDIAGIEKPRRGRMVTMYRKIKDISMTIRTIVGAKNIARSCIEADQGGSGSR